MPKHYTVSQLAKLCHLSVRALHHYDAIAILRPSLRSAAGYRLYSAEDALRLREIVLYRELGFSLEAVARVLKIEPPKRATALLQQRGLIEAKLAHSQAVLQVLDATLNSLRNEDMNNNDHAAMTDSIGNAGSFAQLAQFESGEYAKEAQARWGDSPAWKEANKRKAKYDAAQWQLIQNEAEAITQAFLAAMHADKAHESTEVQALAESHRAHIERWFYACSPAMHRCVTAMYVSDPRFQAHYDRHAPGLAAYIAAACERNADRFEAN
jgi:DNA-binding transcriptional MerR regulator